MPLLLCPNCNVSTQPVDRSGVQFDMCPTCRGVWLDRGELEKLMSAAQAEAAPSAYPQDPGYAPGAPPRNPPPQQQGGPWRRDDDDDDDRRYRDERYRDGRYQEDRGEPPRRRRGFDLFDIFD